MSTSKVYLTKRMVLRAARRGIKAASQETMKVMGYNVLVMDGWVVKKYLDGTIEQIEKVVDSEVENDLQLD